VRRTAAGGCRIETWLAKSAAESVYSGIGEVLQKVGWNLGSFRDLLGRIGDRWGALGQNRLNNLRAGEVDVPSVLISKSGRRFRFTILLLVLSVAAFLRFYKLTDTPPGLYRDEAMDGANALEVLETRHFQVFYPEDNGREGLYINVAAAFINVWGNKAWVVRLPAAIFGLLTVLGVYSLAAELFSVPIGLLAAFFIATSFWHINFSRLAFRAIASPLFLVWTLFCLLLAFRHLRTGKSYLALMVLTGIIYALGFYTYIAYRATPVLIGVVLWHYAAVARKEGWREKFWKGSVVFALTAILVTSPLGVYFARNPRAFVGRAVQVSVLRAHHSIRDTAINTWKTARMLYTAGDGNWRHNDSGRAEVFWPVAILMTLGFLIAIARCVFSGPTQDRLAYGLVLAWLVTGAAPAILSNESIPHALRAIIMVPPVFMLCAIGACALYSESTRMVHCRIVQIVAIALFLALTYEGWHTYFVLWASNPLVASSFDIGYVELADEINAYPRNLPKAVAVRDPRSSLLPPYAPIVMYLTKTYTQRE
jgi:4-amino-4-deoxy-L-arabinose transferase-like glycosyltransferase